MSDEQIHQLLESSRLHHPDLQRAHRLIVGPAPAVHVIQPLLHCDAALRRHLVGYWRRVGLSDRVLDLPVDDVVARDRGRIGVASVLDEERVAGLEKALGGGSDAAVEILLVRFVVVDAEDDVAAANEPELRRVVVESGHLKHVANAVTVEP